MGREIVYCHKCGSKIHPTDFDKGKAVWLDNRAACAKCAPKSGGTSKRITGVHKAVTAKIAAPEPVEEEAAPPAAKLRLMMLAGTGAVGLIVLIGVLYLVLRSSPPPAPPPAAAKAAAAPAGSRKEEAVPLTPREREAKEALEEARKFGADRPDDLPGRMNRLQDVVFQYDNTAAGREAKTEFEALKAKLEDLVQKSFALLEERVKPLEAKEEFGAALGILKEARKEIDAPAWTLRLDKRTREIEDRVAKEWEPLENAVLDARAANDVAKVMAARERVARWAMKDYSEKLAEVAGPAPAETAKPATPPPPTPAPAPATPAKPAIPVEAPPRSAEAGEYRERWAQALRRVASREFAAASKELAGAEWKEEETRKEAAADAEDLRRMAALWEQALESLRAAKKGAFLSLETRQKKVAGWVVEAEPERLEMRAEGEKDTVFVELADLVGACLAPHAKAEPRLVAQLALADGGIEGATALVGAAPDQVAAKYWAFAKDAPHPERRDAERAALALYYAAQREYRRPATRAAAVEKYQALINEHAAVPAVLRLLPQLQKRAQSCREYLLGGVDLKGGGTVKPEKHAVLDKAMISKADSDLEQTPENFAEFEFVALPGVAYRSWVYLGGCCAETFGCYLQATDLTLPNPEKPKETMRAEPETLVAVPFKHGIRNLKPSHASHKKDPKAATRWDWAELPLPKFPAAGLKRVRLCTSQQGFGLGFVIVSSTRKLVPSEAEFKEMLKTRAAEPPPAAIEEPGLVAHWSFDEGFADVTGHGHDAKPEQGAATAPGRSGTGASFDGRDDLVTVPDREDLRLAGDLTIAFWMKKSGEPGEWSRLIGKGDTKVRNYGLWEAPGADRKLLFQQYNANGDGVLTLNSTKEVAVGTWTHVAAVVGGNKASLYVDGVLDASAVRSGVPGTSNQPLTFGSGIHGFYHGLLDEVRIYNRALGADEIRALAGK